MSKIYDYIDMLSKRHNDKMIEFIKDIHDLEDENTQEDISIYRVIALDHKNFNAKIYDYEDGYDENGEDCIHIWQSELNYAKSLDYIKEYGKEELHKDAESLLLYDFMYADKYLIKGE